jgi:hypothetical protein
MWFVIMKRSESDRQHGTQTQNRNEQARVSDSATQ